jgi:hypothetical protein
MIGLVSASSARPLATLAEISSFPLWGAGKRVNGSEMRVAR